MEDVDLSDSINDEDIMKLFEYQTFELPPSRPLQEGYDFVEFDDMDKIMERNQRIQQISQDSGMIYDMFKDLQELVYGQQDMINLIEDNINKSNHYVKKSEVELIEAEIIQTKSARRFMLLSSMLIAGVSTPVGFTLGLKAGLGTAGGLSIGSLFYKII